MAERTTNYGLTKPAADEFYDIRVSNGNMDIIDKELKELQENSTKIIVSEANIPVAERKPNSFYFFVTDSSPTPTSPNITVAPQWD